MRVASRHLPWLVALLALAAVPVCLAMLRSERWDECRDPEALLTLRSRLPGEPAEHRPFSHSHVFQRDEGELKTSLDLQPIRYRIVRSDEPRYPIEQPTRFLQVPMDPERVVVRRVDVDGQQVPIHMYYAHFGTALRIASSLYIYEGQPVDGLLPLQLRSALAQLVRGKRPITLFQVHTFGEEQSQETIEVLEVQWLVSAWRAYLEVCGSASQGPGD